MPTHLSHPTYLRQCKSFLICKSLLAPAGAIQFADYFALKVRLLFELKSGAYYVITKLSNIPIAEEVIRDNTEFPFSYYALAIIYLENNDKEKCKYFANKAIEILNVTTTISGHAPDHDSCLQHLSKVLIYLNQSIK